LLASGVDLRPRARRSFEGRRDTKSRRPEELYDKPSFACDFDAGTAFSRLKALVGDWDVESSRGKAHSRFELIAGASVLLEHFTEPGGQEMLTALRFIAFIFLPKPIIRKT
jgi:hypothetical protein